MVLCKTLRIGRIPTTGFVFSADKYADAKPFITTLHISYPARPGATVSLVKAGDTLDACIQDAVLDSAGNADVQYTVSKKQTLYAMVKEGDCCTTFNYPPCLVSNYISFEVPPAGSISFSSVPGGTEIFLDGQDQGVQTPATITDVPAGSHTYALKLANYNDYTGTVNVIEDQTVQVSATLDVMEGCIIFNSTPQGAKIYIDEVEVPDIVTPGIVCGVSLGTHTYRLVLADYTPMTGPVTLVAGKGAVVSVSLTHETGSISFKSIPDGAEIIIDGVDQLVATPAIITEITGTHDYTLRKAGFNDYSGVITVSVGQTATVEVTLVPAEGCIYFNTTPAGARIFIDNVDTGQVTPALVCGLTLGAHTYRLELPGYQAQTGSVNLAAGQGTTVTGTLSKKGIGTGTIIGLGLLGVGVLGAVIIAKREKKPEYTLPKYMGG